MTAADVTHLVAFHNNDDEFLPITKCVCGARFEPWDFTISIYSDNPHRCPSCNRALFFSFSISVYEVSEQ